MRIEARYDGTDDAVDALLLPFDGRQKSRLRTTTVAGEDVVVLLPRGGVLRHGDRLVAEDGRVVRVEAAPEEVSRVESSDPLLLARAAYHLGNRHIPLQIEPRALSYLHDHVLDHMVETLGLTVTVEQARFEPEGGAYGGGGHGHRHHAHPADHTHDHDHDHDQDHDHDHDHDHG
jgi:urease accessory protein